MDWLNAVRGHVAGHRGRFPSVNDPDRRVRELAGWWVGQNFGLVRDRLSVNRRAALDDTKQMAKQLRAELGAQALRESGALVGAAAAAAAGRASARAARSALHSPHLRPGDAEVLQLRVDHPTLSHAELAKLAGMRRGKAEFARKLAAALKRGTVGDRSGHRK